MKKIFLREKSEQLLLASFSLPPLVSASLVHWHEELSWQLLLYGWLLLAGGGVALLLLRPSRDRMAEGASLPPSMAGAPLLWQETSSAEESPPAHRVAEEKILPLYAPQLEEKLPSLAHPASSEPLLKEEESSEGEGYELYQESMDQLKALYETELESRLDEVERLQGLLVETQLQLAESQADRRRLQKSIDELQLELQQQQQQLGDQQYEIKALLRATDLPVAMPKQENRSHAREASPSSAEKGFCTFDRLLERAGAFSAPAFYANDPSLLEQQRHSSHILDLKRLYELLSSQTGWALLLYSPAEERVLFATPQVEALTGWKAEALAHAFFELVGAKGSQLWKRRVDQLSRGETIQLQLPLRLSPEPFCLYRFQMGWIPRGLFRHLLLIALHRAG